MAPPLQPTARGLVSETEGTLSRITNGVASLPTPSSASSLSADDLVDASGTILLPDGKRVRRPVFPANKEMYSRVPRASCFLLPIHSPLSLRGGELTSRSSMGAAHLMKPDGTPNYMLMSLTSNVYSILPEGTPLTPAVSVRPFLLDSVAGPRLTRFSRTLLSPTNPLVLSPSR